MKKLIEKEIINEINDNRYIILCVESSLFNSDNTMSGGHFIIINGFIDGKVNIINPIKDKYESRKETIDFLINCCINYVSWRLLIKEK